MPPGREGAGRILFIMVFADRKKFDGGFKSEKMQNIVGNICILIKKVVPLQSQLKRLPINIAEWSSW